MAASVLNAPHFQNEDAAFAYVEARLWPNGPVCPHCGNADEKRLRRMQGKTTRKGLIKCYECGKPFTMRMGTIFESSHLPLHLWLQVIHLMCASKKGVSTRQIQRMLSCSMKTAWFLTHRIREAMRDGSLSPMGGAGQVVEIDEAYIGGRAKNRAFRDPAPKKAVVTLVERDGRARSFHVANVTGKSVGDVLAKHADKKSALMTDESPVYPAHGETFENHLTVNHSAGEYVRLGGFVHTNTVEGFYSILKRGINGVYHSVSKQHLHRYLAEFDFRYSNREKLGIDDNARADLALDGVKGKRLTYETTRC